QLDVATSEQIRQYIRLRQTDYEEWHIGDTELYDSYRIDFINFERHHFEKAKNETKLLRDFLRKNGVFVRKAGRLIAGEMVKALHEPETWPLDDKERPQLTDNQPQQNSSSNLTQNIFRRNGKIGQEEEKDNSWGRYTDTKAMRQLPVRAVYK
ncbi:hypothetical protein GcM3_217029, partial [Golovinomyces cichoracearum]